MEGFSTDAYFVDKCRYKQYFATGSDVDFVIEQGQTVLAIEIKSGDRVEQFAKNSFVLPLSA